ncbi:MAG TPA: hypothetical protein HA271_03055 [Methanobacterium subterraneum]|uniref:Uncharacterized protein n=1 Tax=Methanobacterium subterraneum TaxID=59277 RepID=A0A7J4TIP4_9EURY|nr:hypothetical protein [Methanobacterium subterraneum]
MMTELATITFQKEKIAQELIVPEEFVKDLHFSSEDHLMIMLRVIGKDSKKVKEFFEESENELFILETKQMAPDNTPGNQVSGKFVLNSMYIDEGPPLSVDINQEISMVRTILDFKRMN